MPGGSGSDHAQAGLGAGCDSWQRNASQRPVPSRRNKARAYNMGPAQGVLARGLDARQHLMPSSTKRVPIPNAHCPLDACREHPEMAACTARSPHLARTAAKMKIQNFFKLGTNSLSASLSASFRPSPRCTSSRPMCRNSRDAQNQSPLPLVHSAGQHDGRPASLVAVQ